MRDNRSSKTALKILYSLVFLDQNPKLKPLLPKDCILWSRRLLHSLGLTQSFYVSLYENPLFGRFATWIETQTMPGQMLAFGLRKRFLEDETRQAIQNGTTQVLCLGAGFDTLCLRLAPLYPNVRFLEIDHSATQALKQKALQKQNVSYENLSLLPVDLSKRKLEEVLDTSDVWHKGAPSVVIAEGLLMYLTEEAISSLLRSIHRSIGEKSVFLFTYLRAKKNKKLILGKTPRLARVSLKMLGEPFLWGLEPESAPSFFREHGFLFSPEDPRCDRRKRYLAPANLVEETLSDLELVGLASAV